MFAAERELTIALDAGSDQARSACRSALSELGWMISRDRGALLEAFEDPTGLRCRTTPSTMKIELVTLGEDETVVKLNGSAPGIGRAPARRLTRQLAALGRRLTRAQAAA